MATVLIEGFDRYGGVDNTSNVNNLLLQGWNSITGTAAIAAGLSSTGNSVVVPNGQMNKTLQASYNRLIVGFRFQGTLGSISGIQFLDGTNVQFSVPLNATTGTIGAVRGDFLTTGTILNTSTQSVRTAETHFLEIDVTFAIAGSYTVYLDSTQIFTGAGNTITTANTTANTIRFVSAGTGALTIDDLYVFDSSTSLNNAVLLTNPRIEARFPSGDSQTQFSNVGNLIGNPAVLVVTTGSTTANQLYLRKFTNQVATTCNSISIIPAATTVGAKFKGVLYSDVAGVATTLLKTGTEVVGTTNGTVLTSPFSSGQALSAATPYWIGFITDSAVALEQNDNTTLFFSASNTYASGAPTPAPSMTAGSPSWAVYGNCSGAATNWESVALNPPAGDASSISSSTPGNEDLYTLPTLSSSVNTVYVIKASANAKRSDSGTQALDLRVKSSTADSAGNNPAQIPPNTYTWLSSYFDTDPNTSAAWGVSAANAITAGPKVTGVSAYTGGLSLPSQATPYQTWTARHYASSNLLAHDYFTAANLDTTNWNPWVALPPFGRLGGGGGNAVSSPYSAWISGSGSSGLIYYASYFDPYPYSSGSTNTSGNHMIGGPGTITSQGGLQLTASVTSYGASTFPIRDLANATVSIANGSTTATLTANGTIYDALVNGLRYWIVGTGIPTSTSFLYNSSSPNTFIMSNAATATNSGATVNISRYGFASAALTGDGKNFMAPTTGCYIQMRSRYPDLTTGAWSNIEFYPESGISNLSIEGGYTEFSGSVSPNQQFLVGFFDSTTTGILTPSDMSQAFHTWGFEYWPGLAFTIYIDGAFQYSTAATIFTGSISGSTLSVSNVQAVNGGSLQLGQYIRWGSLVTGGGTGNGGYFLKSGSGSTWTVWDSRTGAPVSLTQASVTMASSSTSGLGGSGLPSQTTQWNMYGQHEFQLEQAVMTAGGSGFHAGGDFVTKPGPFNWLIQGVEMYALP